MDIKILTKLGLSIMTPEAREERLDRVLKNNVIDAAALAELIDECREACSILTEVKVERITEQQKIQIRWMLSRISGKEAVAQMSVDELTEWVLELKAGGGYTFSEKAAIVQAIIRMS